MRYFLDTEFIEDGKTIDLISIGLVADDPAETRTLYLQNLECDFSKGSDWVWRNVYPHLQHFNMSGRRDCTPRGQTRDSGLYKEIFSGCEDPGCCWATKREISKAVVEFCNMEKYGKPEFWGYFADYDWVAFCQLFGPMVALPKGFPMYCRDLKQWADYLGNVRIPKPEAQIHHALADARWIKSGYEFLCGQPRP